jgi:hypothetical protein
MNDIVSGPPTTEADRAPDHVEAGSEQVTAERAQKKRGEKQSAAEAAAKRYDGGNRLQNEYGGNDRQWHRDNPGEMQRAMSRRHHLRRQQCKQTHSETAQRRAQRQPDSSLR